MSKSDSTASGFAGKPNKPHPEFPLFPPSSLDSPLDGNGWYVATDATPHGYGVADLCRRYRVGPVGGTR